MPGDLGCYVRVCMTNGEQVGLCMCVWGDGASH